MSRTAAAPAGVGSPGRSAVRRRRVGDVLTLVVDLLMLFGANVWPGWEVLPFLTADTTQVLPLVNLVLVLGAGTALVYLVAGTPLVRAFGDLVATSAGLIVTVRIWEVFPIEDGGAAPVIARILLGLGIVGASIGVIAQVVAVVRALASGDGGDRAP